MSVELASDEGQVMKTLELEIPVQQNGENSLRGD
jgi:hypothetical protein